MAGSDSAALAGGGEFAFADTCVVEPFRAARRARGDDDAERRIPHERAIEGPAE